MNQASVKLIELLTKEEYKNYIKEIFIQHENNLELMHQHFTDNSYSDHIFLLMVSFDFAASELGLSYWHDIIEKLKKIENDTSI